MIFGKIRSRLRNRVTKRMILAELMAVREELKAERKARSELCDALLHRRSWITETVIKRLDKGFEGLEKNDMAMLESIDKWGERFRLLIEDSAPVPQRDEGVSEAQVKREWFGEDEPV